MATSIDDEAEDDAKKADRTIFLIVAVLLAAEGLLLLAALTLP